MSLFATMKNYIDRDYVEDGCACCMAREMCDLLEVEDYTSTRLRICMYIHGVVDFTCGWFVELL